MTTGSKYVINDIYATSVDTHSYPPAQILLYWRKLRSWNGADSVKPYSSSPRFRPSPKGKRMAPNIPAHPYTLTVEEYKDAHCVFYSKTSGSYAGYTTSVAVLPVTPWLDPSIELKVIGNLAGKIFGSGFNPAVCAAEGKEAFDMISKSVRALSGALEACKARRYVDCLNALGLTVKGRARRRKNLGRGRTAQADPEEYWRTPEAYRRSIASLWLEVQYGWLPLLKDLEEAGQWIASALTDPVHLTRVASGKEWGYTAPIDVNWDPCAYSECDVSFKLRYIALNVSKLPAVGLPSLATVASVAWERLPYSFIFDWFAPIGAYLEACRLQANTVGGTWVRSLKVERAYKRPKTGYNSGYSQFGVLAGSPMYKYTQFSRTVSTELSLPNPLSRLEDAPNFHSWRHAANAAALFLQRNLKAASSI